MTNDKYLGYIKYKGKKVEDGLMDARKQANALLGLDNALRYFIGKQLPDLVNTDYEIPIKIQKGSWEALIPETTIQWIQTSAYIGVGIYAKKAIEKMAEKDFADTGLKDIVVKAIDAIKWFAKIAIHLGDASIREFNSVKFSDNNSKIGIRNSDGEYLDVPKYILDLYISSDPKLLAKLAGNIDVERELIIATIIDSEVDEVSINTNNKRIFISDDEESDEILFPELLHGAEVVLDGEVTRENKTANNMGFKYLEHILTASPETGSIVQYKSILFLKCRLFGVVSRIDEKGKIGSKRPKLIFTHIEPLEKDPEIYTLF